MGYGWRPPSTAVGVLKFLSTSMAVRGLDPAVDRSQMSTRRLFKFAQLALVRSINDGEWRFLKIYSNSSIELVRGDDILKYDTDKGFVRQTSGLTSMPPTLLNSHAVKKAILSQQNKLEKESSRRKALEQENDLRRDLLALIDMKPRPRND